MEYRYYSSTLCKYKLWAPVWLIPCSSYGHDYGSAAMVLVPGIATVRVLPLLGQIQADTRLVQTRVRLGSKLYGTDLPRSLSLPVSLSLSAGSFSFIPFRPVLYDTRV